MINEQALKEAIILTQQGKYDEAEEIYKKLIINEPDNYIILSMFGLFYININDYKNAYNYLHRAYNIKKTFGTVSALGFCEFEQKKYDEASKFLEESLELGQNEDVYNKLVLSLFQIKEYKKAILYADKMYELYPNSSLAIANQVKSLTQQGKLLEAQTLCVNELKRKPDSAALWFHLGYLKELIFCDDIQAKECYKAAADLGNPEAYYNIAVSCQKLGEYQEAENYYKKMLEHFPKDKDTITSLGMCYLTQKRFKEGYDLFFQRDKSKLSKYSKNTWQIGDDFENEIVVICDQGFGDHIQFVRYLPFLNSRQIILAAPNNLRKLFESNYTNVKIIDYEEIPSNIQSIRISDLAYALNMDFDNIPFSSGYLKVPPLVIENKKIKVGLCWEAGNAGIRTMINRTINIKCFESILNLENIQIYSFQVCDTLKGNEKYTQMINLAKDFRDFYDTAQALLAMDVLITVDTSVAHLAGALGVKTYLLLPYASDWRWFDETKSTPWYDSIEIFKQKDKISWENEINQIIQNINNFSQQNI